MNTNKSTYERFNERVNEAVVTILSIAAFLTFLVMVKGSFISPKTIEAVISKSEKQAFEDGVNKALNQ